MGRVKAAWKYSLTVERGVSREKVRSSEEGREMIE